MPSQIKKRMPINLKYFNSRSNVGDQVSLAIARHYFSSNVIPWNGRRLKEPNLILAGSVITYSDPMSHVCGAGLMSPEFKMKSAPKNINCTRGPLTAFFLERQGIPAPQIFADPGVLAAKLFPRNSTPNTKIGIVPHYVDSTLPWVKLCRDKGIPILDVCAPLDTFFDDLEQCEIILSSSLHGIIFAHSYGKPALWIELSDKVYGNGFKFFDYYLSMGISPENVTRFRIFDDTDPFDIAELATIGDHSTLLKALEQAIPKTIQEYKRHCTVLRSWKKMPSISRSMAKGAYFMLPESIRNTSAINKLKRQINSRIQ